MYLIIISIAVVLILWFTSNQTYFLYAPKSSGQQQKGSSGQQQKGSSGQQKGSSGQQQKGSSGQQIKSGSGQQQKGSSGQQKGSSGQKSGSGQKQVTRKVNSVGNKKISSGGNKKISGRDKVTTTSLAPTKEQLAKALAAYTKNNKSGKVDPSSAYKDLVDRGYLYFKNGKWQSRLQPSGQPAVGSGVPGIQVPGGNNTGGNNTGGGPSGKLSGGLANLAWDDYNNKYSNKTAVGDAKVVMTDTRNNIFDLNPNKIKEYNKQLTDQGKVPMAYMNTGLIDKPSDFGKDPYFKKLYDTINNAGLLGAGTNKQWTEPILNGQKLLNDPKAFNTAMGAYRDFVKSMKSLGYKAINVDNLDFYNQGKNSSLSKSDQLKLGQKWQSAIADVIKQEGMYAIAKNAPDLINAPGSTYVQKWDGIVTENAKTKGWDDTQAYKKFADAGKPVWNFQTKTSGSSQDLPNWMDSYAVGGGNQGWWEM